MLEIGSYVDAKYKILQKIGQGGMSVVYLAINERARKYWAIKEVRKDGVKDFETLRQGLIVETELLTKLRHPHLPSIVDIIDYEDTFLIVMDYIEGRTLGQTLRQYGAQPEKWVVFWGKQLCDVLGYLHGCTPPIIYRDMKPGNVMLKPDGNIMLIDFGTAREFKERSLDDTVCLGTVRYAAPEQYGGRGQTDARTDIYCLGVTLYHLVTGLNPGEPPYEMKPFCAVNPALSGGLEHIIRKCTRRNPMERYQSCAELMDDLEHYQEIGQACGTETEALITIREKDEIEAATTTKTRTKTKTKKKTKTQSETKKRPVGLVGALIAAALLVSLALWGGLNGMFAFIGNGGGEASLGDHAPGIIASPASDEDCFEWSGAVITGLTEKGKQISDLVIPLKATEIRTVLSRQENLKTIKFNNKNIILGQGLFESCTSLTKVELPGNLQEIPDKMFFNCTALTEISIPGQVTKIGASVFFQCTSLQRVTDGDALEIIESSAFEGCSNLREFVFSSSLKTIGYAAFSRCKSLENIQFQSGLTKIDNYAFNGCEKITSVVIPEGVTEIGLHAFYGCYKLAEVQLPESLTYIAGDAFTNGSAKTFKVKKGSYADSNFSKFTFHGDMKEYY